MYAGLFATQIVILALRPLENAAKGQCAGAAADAFLTLISAYYHQDQNTLERAFPLINLERFKKLSSPEMRSHIIAMVRKSTVRRVLIENESPQETDLCAIFLSESPNKDIKDIDEVFKFGYVEGAWRFLGSDNGIDSWLQSAGFIAEMTRNALQQW